jgi:hypothetical protein
MMAMLGLPLASENLQLRSTAVGSLLILAALCGCSGEPSSSGATGSNGALQPFGSGSSTATPGSMATTPPGKPAVIEGFGRAPGMAIGTGVPDDTGGDDDGPGTAAPGAAPAESDDIAIPVFAEAPMAALIPCTGCVELSAILDDINQRSDFTFNVGGVQVTRVVWTLLLSFNSDQLFIRSIIDGNDGPYTAMSANNFGSLNTPVEFVHPFSGTATNIGIAFGSQGAWTGEQRISVFVDSVTLEGPSGTSRTFDADAGGFAPRGTDRQPLVQFH